MQSLKHFWATFRHTLNVCEQRVDHWVVKNPIAIWNHMRFRSRQRKLNSSNYRRFMLLLKFFALGYLTSNLFELQLNAWGWSNPRPVMYQYQILANYAEYDQLGYAGRQDHFKEIMERGKKRQLSQVQLFELGKFLDLNYTSKSLVYHVDYLRNLKSGN